jgi:hypothetical protein
MGAKPVSDSVIAYALPRAVWGCGDPWRSEALQALAGGRILVSIFGTGRALA